MRFNYGDVCRVSFKNGREFLAMCWGTRFDGVTPIQFRVRTDLPLSGESVKLSDAFLIPPDDLKLTLVLNLLNWKNVRSLTDNEVCALLGDLMEREGIGESYA